MTINLKKNSNVAIFNFNNGKWAKNMSETIQEEWVPAQLNGSNVRFFQTYPINFEYQEFLLESFDYYNGLVQFERK